MPANSKNRKRSTTIQVCRQYCNHRISYSKSLKSAKWNDALSHELMLNYSWNWKSGRCCFPLRFCLHKWREIRIINEFVIFMTLWRFYNKHRSTEKVVKKGQLKYEISDKIKTHPSQSIRFRKDITGCHTATPYPRKSVVFVSTLSEANVNPICASSLCTTALLEAFSGKHMGWQLSFQVLALLLPPSSTHLANTLISGAKP